MKLAWVLLLSACAPWERAVPASFVPALELRATYRVRRAIEAEHSNVGVGAWLRWTPRSAASAVPSQVAQTPAAWVAPCALDDLVCLSEAAEAEREIADALRELP
jgi:hypothetical protein